MTSMEKQSWDVRRKFRTGPYCSHTFYWKELGASSSWFQTTQRRRTCTAHVRDHRLQRAGDSKVYSSGGLGSISAAGSKWYGELVQKLGGQKPRFRALRVGACRGRARHSRSSGHGRANCCTHSTIWSKVEKNLSRSLQNLASHSSTRAALKSPAYFSSVQASKPILQRQRSTTILNSSENLVTCEPESTHWVSVVTSSS